MKAENSRLRRKDAMLVLPIKTIIRQVRKKSDPWEVSRAGMAVNDDQMRDGKKNTNWSLDY